jgi:PTS hybrid protein
MLGLFMVSQSGLIAQGLMELISHCAPGIPVMAVGGGPDGNPGCDQERIYGALEDICSAEGTIVLFDSGISYRAARVAAADLRFKGTRNITILPAALLEGAAAAAELIQKGSGLGEVIEALDKLKLDKV